MNDVSTNIRAIKEATDTLRTKLDMASDPISDVVDAVIVPTGSIRISESGTYDVTDYEEAVVDVSGSGSKGNMYKVNSIAARDSIEDAAEGSLCIVNSTQDGFISLFRYTGTTWSSENIGCDAMATDVYKGKRAYTNGGFVDGSLGNTVDLTTIKSHYAEICGGISSYKPTDLSNMFAGSADVNIPILKLLDSSSVTNMTNMFASCLNLGDDTLNDILTVCINATSYNGTKKLSTLGITDTTLTERIPNLDNYQAFIDAGWTIE